VDNDISYSFDNTSALAALSKLQKGYDDTQRAAVVAGEKTDQAFQKSGVVIRSTADRAQTDAIRMVEGLRRVAVGVDRTGESLASMVKHAARATTGYLEMATAVAIATKAVAAHATATSTMEAALNRARVARIGFATYAEGLGGGAAVATQIAGVLALEKIMEVTYSRGRELQRQAIEMQRTGLSYQDTVTVDFASKRQGVSPELLRSGAKAAGGIDEFASKLRELGEIKDPFEQAHQSMVAFGADFEKYLPLMNSRLSENIEQTKSWGLALSEVSRTNISQFTRDIDDLRGAFRGIGDDFHASMKNAGNYFSEAFGAAWAQGHAFADFMNKTFPAPRPEGTLGPRELLQGHRDTVQSMALGPANYDPNLPSEASKYFLKGDVGDREAALRSRLSSLRSQLFVTNLTDPNYGKVVSGASYPGGPAARAIAEQSYVSGNRELVGIEKQRDADRQREQSLKEIASAQASVASIVQSAQLGELSGIEKLKAERDIAIGQYGKTKDQIQQINGAFDLRLAAEWRKMMTDGYNDIIERAKVAAAAQKTLMEGRSRNESSTFLAAYGLNAQGATKRGEIQYQQIGIDRDRQLSAAQTYAEGIFDPDLSKGQDREQSLQRKVALESQKLAIESDYLNKSRNLQASGIIGTRDADISSYQTMLDAKLISQAAFTAVSKNISINADLDLQKLSAKTDADIATARDQAAVASARLITETYKQQFDSIKKEAESLYTTLFTHPKDFGKQLATTLKTAALRPVIDNLSNMTASSLHPLIYGADGQGGIAGAMKFGGPLSDIKVEGDGSINVNVRGMGDKGNIKVDGGNLTINGAPSGGTGGGSPLGLIGIGRAPTAIARSFAPFFRPQTPGGGGESVSSSVSFPGGDQNLDLGTSYTSGPGSSGGGAYGGGLLPGMPSGSSFDDFGSAFGNGWTGSGSGGGFATSYSGGSSVNRGFLGGAFGGLTKSFGGGKGLAGMLGGFKNLGPSFGIGGAPKSVGLYGDTIADNSTTFSSVANSAGVKSIAGTVGMPLLSRGLWGRDEGTGRGVLEGAAGGAAVGFQYGGPIGAAVGAVAGTLAGLGEMAAGVESPSNKAKRLVMSTYHINIPNSVADQIAALAKSKYASQVGLAVRSPEVRQMLGLYAAGTGQAGKFPQSADIPHGGSLANQGGTLFQQATYQYGNPYTYQSNLPVLGGNAGGSLPNPGGNINLSLNVDGASTENFLNGGVFTPSAVGDKVNANWAASGARTSSSMMLQDPTGTVS
jgi:hypothetical protein